MEGSTYPQLGGIRQWGKRIKMTKLILFNANVVTMDPGREFKQFLGVYYFVTLENNNRWISQIASNPPEAPLGLHNNLILPGF